jgi:hypothetical protein
VKTVVFGGAQYNRKVADALAVQQDIAKAISEKLRAGITGEEQSRLSKHYSENVEAHQLYLLGRYHSSKESVDGLTKAVKYFQQAIDKDPGSALAYAGLADSYGSLGALTFLSFPRQKQLQLEQSKSTIRSPTLTRTWPLRLGITTGTGPPRKRNSSAPTN